MRNTSVLFPVLQPPYGVRALPAPPALSFAAQADEQSTVAPGELAEATDINCGPDPEPWTCFITPPFFWHALSELCTYSGALCPLNPFDGSKGQVRHQAM